MVVQPAMAVAGFLLSQAETVGSSDWAKAGKARSKNALF
jgi:hypothetical protein